MLVVVVVVVVVLVLVEVVVVVYRENMIALLVIKLGYEIFNLILDSRNHLPHVESVHQALSMED